MCTCISKANGLKIHRLLQKEKKLYPQLVGQLSVERI